MTFLYSDIISATQARKKKTVTTFTIFSCVKIASITLFFAECSQLEIHFIIEMKSLV